MKKMINRVIAILLTICMSISFGGINVAAITAADNETINMEAKNESVFSSNQSQTVWVTLYMDKDAEIKDLSVYVDIIDNTNIGAEFAEGTELGNADFTEKELNFDGKLGAIVLNDKNVARKMPYDESANAYWIAKVPVVIPANVTGRVDVLFSEFALGDTSGNPFKTSPDTVTATIEVKAPEVAKTGFEVYYTLNKDADADDDKYVEYGVGDTVSADVYLVNYGMDNVLLQAYDIYLTYDSNLSYVSDDFVGTAYKADGNEAATADVVDHIQLVAEDGVKIAFPKGVAVPLGTINFTVANTAVYDTDIPITLEVGDDSEEVTNIAVGTEAQLEGGDKTSYYPKDVSEFDGVEIDTKHTVTFYDGESKLGEAEVGHNTTATAITAPNKAGYTFGGWYADKELTDEFEFTTKITTDTSVYAKYEQNTVQVIWMSQDGKTTLKSAAEVIGAALKDIAPEAPAKAEDNQYTYTFAGWATSANQETGTMPENLGNVTEAVTYYAAYSKNVRSYTVNFYNEDGTKVLKTDSVAFGTAPTAPSNPTKEGNAQYTYQFAGWAASVNGEVLETLPNVGGAADYYAVFTAIPVEYTVTWNADGTETEDTVAFGAEFPAAPADPVKNGYKFDGWDVNGDGKYDAGTDVLPTIMPANNMTIKAVFSLVEYTITFNLDGGTMDNGASASMTYYVTDAITLPTASKNAFSFGGWEVVSTDTTSSWSGTVSGTVAAGQYGNVTLKAVWSEKPLDIEVVIPDNVGGSASVENLMGGGATAEPGDDIKISVVPQPGYVFDEEEIEIKYKDENGVEQVIKVEKNEDGEFIFTIPEDLKSIDDLLTGSVVFTALEYDVVFDKNAADATGTVEGITATFEEDIQLNGDVYSRPGYEFLGWSADKNAAAATYVKDALIADNLMTPTVGGENTVTLYAVWEAIDYTVTVEDDIENGEVSIKEPQDTYNIGDDVTLVVTPDEGYEAEITVTYKDENGDEHTVPVDEDNTFDMPAGDVTVNVVFNLVNYKINVYEYIEDGTVTAPENAKMGETVELTVNPAEGYELATLTVTKDGVTGDDAAVPVTGNSFTMPANDVTVAATFRMKEFNITVADGIQNGSVYSEMNTACMGETVTLHALPNAGYAVDQIIVKDANGAPVEVTDNTFKMPASDVTVTATFKVVPYTITYDLGLGNWTEGNGFVDNKQSYTVENSVTLPSADMVEYDGYVLDAWIVEGDGDNGNWGGDGDRYEVNQKVNAGMYGSVTLKALWLRETTPEVEEYKYAQNGYVMLRVKAPSAANMEYQFDGESMYYIDNEYYNIDGTAVFYTLIPVDYYDKATGTLTDDGYALLKQEACTARKTVNYACDINQDGVVNVADANAVYQMTQFTGKYYSVGQFDTERRLSADLDKGTGRNTNELRGSIEDVHVIINEINGVAQTNG